MMTIEEKLQHFYDVSVEEARSNADQIIRESKETLDQMLKAHKKNRRVSAEADIKAETENVRHEVNKALSAEQLTIKRNWNQKQHDLRDRLFEEVKGLLKEFMTTPEYDAYLCKKIAEAKDFAGSDELQIYLTAGDGGKASALSQKTGVDLLVSQDDFLGGIKAIIPSKNILIDSSFLESIRSMSRNFKFDGGPKYE